MASLGLALGTSLAIGLLPACATRVVREPVFDREGVHVYLRREVRHGEPIGRGFDHPVTIAPVRLLHILARLELRPVGRSERESREAIPIALLRPIADGLAQALERADPASEVVVQAVRTERRFGIFTRELLTSLVVYAQGENLVLHVIHSDWPLPGDVDPDAVPEPHAGSEVQPFRLLPGEKIETTGPHAVAVAWRDPVFSRPRSLVDRPGGRLRKRTILLQSPEEPGALPPLPPVPPDLEPARRRALERLEERRRRGEIPEAQYRRERRAILEGSSPPSPGSEPR